MGDRRKGSVRYFVVTAMTLFLILGCVILFAGVEDAKLKKAEARRETKIYAERTEALLNSLFHKTDILESIIITSKGDVPEETFRDLARSMMDSPGIRAVQYLPGGTVRYCYPLEGNEAVLGDNIFQNPLRKKDARLAVDTKEIALSGPYDLSQGGFGLVARNPIFLTDKEGREYFWGFSVIILDLPDAIGAIHLEELEQSGYEYSLHCMVDSQPVVITQSAGFTGQRTIDNDINVPNHTWTLTLQSKAGWLPWTEMAVEAVIVLLLSLLCGALVYMNKKKQEQIHRMAVTDELTGAYNRRWLKQFLEKACLKGAQPFMLLYMDLNGFKKINDVLGHGCGDLLLVEVARRLEGFLGPSDILSRMGGDEFIMILKQEDNSQAGQDIAENIRRVISSPYNLGAGAVGESVGISIGIACFPGDGEDSEQLMKIADERMYADKQNSHHQTL